MKKCPHCHEETFGALQLLGLDYFSVTDCRECNQPVRNDGLRQFLMLPAILAVMLAGFLMLSIFPEVLEPFAILLILFLFGLSMVLLPKPVKFGQDVTRPPFSPDLQNDKVITVSGWNEDELRQILDGFIAENGSGWPQYLIELDKQHENRFRLTFAEDIHPLLFVSLVNYAVYPIEFETANRRIIVAGETTLNGSFDGIPAKLFGKKALFYVPENDEDHDVVYLQSETSTFANSFSEKGWRRVDEARLPLEVKKLAREMAANRIVGS